MQVKQIVTAVALAVAAVSSFADSGGGPLTFIGGTVGFSRTPTGPTFTDTWTFSLMGTSFLTSSSVTSAVVGTDPIANIDFSSVYIDNILSPATHYNFTQTSFDPIESYGIANLLLVPGDYELHINGSQTPTPASYGGNLTVIAAAVPEPETYALLLAGLGALGFMLSRRRTR